MLFLLRQCIAYDTQGRPLAAWGSTYPVANEYDTAGRRTSLSTTRDPSVDFGALASHLASGQSLSSFASFGSLDTTRWHSDPATGLVTNKVYADDSAVAFTHTPDGKPLRTTWARGAWREHSYTASGLLAGIEYGQAPVPGPATPAVALAYDAFQRPAAASNTLAAYVYANDALGMVTNETAVIGTNVHRIVRTQDGFHRLSETAWSINGASENRARYRYDSENRLAGLAFTNAQGRGVQVAYSNYAGYAFGHTATTPPGGQFNRSVQRDTYRIHLVTQCAQSFNGTNLGSHAYTYDPLDQATARNSDTFAYNARSEVSGASIGTNAYAYSYDGIGNNLWNARNAATNGFTANALNQYAAINALPLTYDPDGNLLTNGVWSYAWDAENRLVAAYSNALCVVSNAYDHAHRRVLKVTPSATHAYVYDDWNLIHETVAATGGSVTEIQYFWGLDLSGTLQGAGGVGGLLAVSMDGSFFFPCFDNNGNITDYVDETGSVVASYLYDAYGGTVSQSGPMADVFPHRFSTKYLDSETNLYYYGYRWYESRLSRWLNRDPIEESGGLNLYAFCGNDPLNKWDVLGQFSLHLFWRPLTDAEMAEFSKLGKEIGDMSDELLSNINEFYAKHFPQARQRPPHQFAQPPELDRSANIGKLHWRLRTNFMIDTFRSIGRLNWALQHISARLQRQREMRDFGRYRMSTCRNPACYLGVQALKTPFFIGICKRAWNDMIEDERRSLLAHEGSHWLHGTQDYYYRQNVGTIVFDAYAWGLLYQ